MKQMDSLLSLLKTAGDDGFNVNELSKNLGYDSHSGARSLCHKLPERIIIKAGRAYLIDTNETSE